MKRLEDKFVILRSGILVKIAKVTINSTGKEVAFSYDCPDVHIKDEDISEIVDDVDHPLLKAWEKQLCKVKKEFNICGIEEIRLNYLNLPFRVRELYLLHGPNGYSPVAKLENGIFYYFQNKLPVSKPCEGCKKKRDENISRNKQH